MSQRVYPALAAVLITFSFAASSVMSRGFGGGGGGARGGFGGGGMGGGMARGGGFSGGAMGGGMRPGGMGGGGMPGGGFERGGFGGAGGFAGAGGVGGGPQRGGLAAGGLGGAGGFDRGGVGAGGLGGAGERFGAGGMGDRFSTPSRGELNNFLGLPSDEGMHNLSGATQFGGGGYFNASGGAFDVNRGSVEGPRGGTAAGATVTGPRGNTVGRGVAEGPNGGVVAGRGVEGAGGARAGQAIGVGPEGRVAGGGAVRGPDGGAAARGFVAGPNGVAAGYARVTPAGRYTAAAAVRTNYNHWDLYRGDWYRRYPGAWYATAWAAGAAWSACTWDSAAAYCGYDQAYPVYYDYGNNVTYQDGSVYLNGQEAGSAEQFYNYASQIAATGTQAQAPPSDEWLPLGVYSLCKPDATTSDVTVQLAVNHAGVIRGNYTDTKLNTNQPIHGSVDKQTQRVAFTVGDNTTNVIETGIYNLTKDEAPVLIHFGQDRTEQWLLARLKQGDTKTPN